MLRKETKIKKILMMMLCIIVSLLSTVSCTKDELSFDQNNQSDNLTDVQARIGNIEGFYEKFENIEKYKDFQFENKEQYEYHQNLLKKFLAYKEFPSVEKRKYTRNQLSQRLLEESQSINDISLSEKFHSKKTGNISSQNELITYYDNFDNKKVYVELFFKLNRETYQYEILLPKEVYKLDFERRNEIRYESFEKRQYSDYLVKYMLAEKYYVFTDISYLDIKNLRKVTFLKENVYSSNFDFSYAYDEDDKTYYIYQFPFIDNYKDYQNDSKTIYGSKNYLKRLIKPGSCIFVFDKSIDELDNHTPSTEGSFGHMMVVSDYYQETKSDQYLDLYQYKKLDKNQEFVEIDALRKDIYDDNVSFENYLKHFVFVEAILSVNYDNTKKDFNKRFGVIYSSGNDKVIQDNFRNKYTVISVSNLNEGIKMTNFNIQSNFVEYCNRSIGKWYKPIPIKIKNIHLYREYCSGLVYYGYRECGLTLLHDDLISELKGGISWYMPRTITNSPFMYTKIWYKR